MNIDSTFSGFMVDCARCLENRDYYRKFIDFIAARGTKTLLWHFTDDQGCALQFDAYPGLASPHAYSKAEMRDLIAYAEDRGVEIVPELASLGHTRYITRLPEFRHLDEVDAHFTGICPVSDETRTIIRTLIEETTGLFPSRNFHVGLDEVNIGGHPLTRAALKEHSRDELLADYIDFVHGVVTSAGKRMWMWGDGLLQSPTMMTRAPRDIVICNWQYTPDASPDTTETLLAAGFDVMLYSALISHDQPLYPGEQFGLPNVRQLESHRALGGHVIGHLTTIWTPVRFIADSLWLGLDLAASILRGEDTDTDSHTRHFAKTFYGLSGEHVSLFANAAKVLLSDAPMRNEWLAVAKLQLQSAALRNRIAMMTKKWSHAHQQINEIAPCVRQHKTEFEAFRLLIEMLAHTYDVAARVAANDTPPSALAKMIHDSETLVHKVDKTWDRERFADDPRKYAAPIASFQNDHLVPLLQHGVTALKRRQSQAVLLLKRDAAAAHEDLVAAGVPAR